jgi:hypothetical protein
VLDGHGTGAGRANWRGHGLAGRRHTVRLGVDVRRRALGSLPLWLRLVCVLRGHVERMGRRQDVDGRVGGARGNLLAAPVAVPVGLLEPVEAAR